MGELGDRLKGNLNEAAGKLKQGSDNERVREEGAAQEVQGRGQQLKGKVKGLLDI
jgi:uncharacterized protein YjbJ (UPF0337 family)